MSHFNNNEVFERKLNIYFNFPTESQVVYKGQAAGPPTSILRESYYQRFKGDQQKLTIDSLQKLKHEQKQSNLLKSAPRQQFNQTTTSNNLRTVMNPPHSLEIIGKLPPTQHKARAIKVYAPSTQTRTRPQSAMPNASNQIYSNGGLMGSSLSGRNNIQLKQTATKRDDEQEKTRKSVPSVELASKVYNSTTAMAIDSEKPSYVKAYFMKNFAKVNNHQIKAKTEKRQANRNSDIDDILHFNNNINSNDQNPLLSDTEENEMPSTYLEARTFQSFEQKDEHKPVFQQTNAGLKNTLINVISNNCQKSTQKSDMKELQDKKSQNMNDEDDFQLEKQEEALPQVVHAPQELKPEVYVISKTPRIEEKQKLSLYNPQHPHYIYRAKRMNKPLWNQLIYTGFVYNGNYPEVIIQALKLRGNWNILNYQQVVNLQVKEQERRALNKKKNPNSFNMRESIEDKQLKEPNYSQVDEMIIDKSNFVWRPVNFQQSLQRKIDKRHIEDAPLIYNHFQQLKEISTKAGLIRSLKQYYYTEKTAQLERYTEFDSCPTTFILQSKLPDQQFEDFKIRFGQIVKGNVPKEKMPLKHCIHNLWLVKPNNENQGRGIEVFNTFEAIVNFVNSKTAGTQWIVQKYIERPLLYNQRKFDIRIWCMMTTKNEIYFYKEGYLRTSGVEYNTDQSNKMVHLTNQCMQIKDKTIYGKFEEGNTLSFDQFQDYLDKNFEGKINVKKDLVPRMKDLCLDAMLSVKNIVNPSRRKNHFELFGFDFLIDEDFRVWLIEVNTNPYLGKPCAWAKEMIPAMVDEMLNIVLDPIYPPRDSYFLSFDYLKRKTNFELIYCEGQVSNYDYIKSGEEMVCFNQRRNYSLSILYPLNNHKQVCRNLDLKAMRMSFNENQNTQNKLNQSQSCYMSPPHNEKEKQKWAKFYESTLYKRINYRPQSAVPISKNHNSRKIMVMDHNSIKNKSASQRKNRAQSSYKRQMNADLQEIKATTEMDDNKTTEEQIVQELEVDYQKNLEVKQQSRTNSFSQKISQQKHKLTQQALKVINSECLTPEREKRQDMINQDFQHSYSKYSLSEQKTNRMGGQSSLPNIFDREGHNPSFQNEAILVAELSNAEESQQSFILEDTLEQKQQSNSQLDNITPEMINPYINLDAYQDETYLSVISKTSMTHFEQQHVQFDQGETQAHAPEIKIDEYQTVAGGRSKDDSVSRHSVGTVIYNEKAISSQQHTIRNESLVQKDSQVIFGKLVRDQTVNLINKKMESYFQLSSSKRIFAEFKPLLKSMCFNFFVENCQEDEEIIDRQLLLQMIGKLRVLIDAEFQNKAQNNLLKPDCIDILIELLRNENTFCIKELRLVMLDTLLLISSQLEAHLNDDSRNNRRGGELRCINEDGLKCKEYLIKTSTLKKLISIHQRISRHNNSELNLEQKTMENILLNASFIKDAANCATKVKLFETQTNRHEKLAAQSRNKCLQNGLFAYLVSGNCTIDSNRTVLQALSHEDSMILKGFCEQQTSNQTNVLNEWSPNEESQAPKVVRINLPFLKQIEHLLDFKEILRALIDHQNVSAQKPSIQQLKNQRDNIEGLGMHACVKLIGRE